MTRACAALLTMLSTATPSATGSGVPVSRPNSSQRSGLRGQVSEVQSQRPVSGPTSSRILVMPFENVTRDGRVFWLTEASAVLLTDDLNALGAGAITRTERQQAFERLQVPPAAVLTDATMIRIGQLVGASQVVVGSLQVDGDTVVVHARSITLDGADAPALRDYLAKQLRDAGVRPLPPGPPTKGSEWR